MNKLKVIIFLLIFNFGFSQEIAVLKYSGGGDWYANPTSLPNLVKFCNQNINTKLNTKVNSVDVGSAELFLYPFVHMTGHGNVIFNNNDVQNLRNYLNAGGFLHIDDNYGMDEYIRKEIKKLYPDNELVEIPKTHQIFQTPYSFPNGLPKIHEHDNKQPQAFGIFIENRLALLYTYECDLGDGWESPEVHNDPLAVREKALKMGANIINYVFSN
ncbi:DUF4159 domain-containing protein [Flavobacterium urocaniciphilum]|uniref:DUF4159 domain-containing protein n=1 Tax=Flavobacterium urocaniciphilum TaxID=1299341 RepID=A0A1H8Z577_9FLAO|nr:DUF4159 domain-containing protein [Flavobacterium urocaniciphilum]SEP59615.1 protein of unknown function [Flavobacterium urocaniciphilum]